MNLIKASILFASILPAFLVATIDNQKVQFQENDIPLQSLTFDMQTGLAKSGNQPLDSIPPLSITAANDTTISVSNTSCSSFLSLQDALLSSDLLPSTLQYSFSGSTIGNGSGQVAASYFNIGSTIITYTATDEAGNTATDVTLVTVIDTIAPTISAPSDLLTHTDDASCSTNMTVEAATFSDNCDSVAIAWFITGASTSFGSGAVATSSFNVGVSTITYTATDEAGNTATDVTVVTVIDTIAPTISAPSDLIALSDDASCSTNITMEAATFSDNCDSVAIAWFITGASASFGSGAVATSSFNVGVSTITYTATDEAGNTATDVTVVTITDTIAPTIIVPDDITATVSQGLCTGEVSIPDVDFDDNCETPVLSWSISGSTQGNGFGQMGTYEFNVGTSTINYLVMDSDSNMRMGQLAVTLFDNEAPTLDVGPDLTINTSNSLCSASLGVPDATFADNCSNVTLSWEMTGSDTSSGMGQVGFYDFPVGTTMIIYTATDSSGNINTKSRNFTIVEKEAPQVLMPPSQTISMDSSSCGITFAVTPSTITDNCLIDSFYWESTGATISNGSGQIGTISLEAGVTTFTFTAIDGSGNIGTGVSQITVVDNEIPQLFVPGDTTLSSDPNYCSKLFQLPAAIFSDNCPGVSLAWSVNGATNKSGTGNPGLLKFNTGNNFVIYSATDAAGNSATDTTIVTILDALPPKIEAGADTTIDITTNSCTANYLPPSITVADNCTVAGISWTVSGNTASSGTGSPSSLTLNQGINLLTYTVTDAAGNIAMDSLTITVVDKTGPTPVAIPDITLATDQGNCTTILKVPALQSLTDNCLIHPDSVSWVLSGASNSSGSSFNDSLFLSVGASLLTYTAIDEAGNTGTTALKITVSDQEAPLVTASPDLTVNTDLNQCSKLFEIPLANYSDNCQAVSLSWVATGVTQDSGNGQTGPIKFNVGTTFIVYTVEDAAKNKSTDTVIILVNDTIPPKINAGMDIQGETSAGYCHGLIAIPPAILSDNCQVGELTWKMTGATLGVGTGQIGNFPFNIGLTTIHYTLFDAVGNFNTDSLVVEIADNQPPTVNAGPDIKGKNKFGQCDAILNVPPAIVDDNCKDAEISWYCYGATNSGGTGQPGFITFKCGITYLVIAAADIYGNVGTDTLVVTLNDEEPPVIEAIADLTVSTDPDLCKATVDIPEIVFYDNCSNATLSWKCSGASSQTGTGQPGLQTFGQGHTKIVFQATDGNGNTSFQTAKVWVIDNQLPTIIGSLTDSTLVGCSYADMPKAPNNLDEFSIEFPDIQIFDNCHLDKKSTIGYADSISGNCPMIVVRTYTIYDKGGNSVNLTHKFTILDTMPPKAICEDIRVELDSSGNMVIDAQDIDDNSMDNCGISNRQLDLESFSCSDIGVNKVVLTVTDFCGNSSSCSANVNVVYELNASYSYTPVSCHGANDGAIWFIDPTASAESYEYTINGGLDWYQDSIFEGLSPGKYDLRFRLQSDSTCTHLLTNNLSLEEPAILKASIETTPISCVGLSDGKISFSNISGGYPTFEYSIDNGQSWQGKSQFEDLSAGTYFPVLKSVNEDYNFTCILQMDSVIIALNKQNNIIDCPKYFQLSGCGPEALHTSNKTKLDYAPNATLITLLDFKKEFGSVKNDCATSGLSYIDRIPYPDSFPIIITRTFSLLSNGIILDSCQQLIQIEDLEAPTIQCANAIVFLSDSSGNVSLDASEIAFGTTDNCGNDGLLFSFDADFSGSTLTVNCSEADMGVTHHKIYVKDAAGNISDCKFGLLVKKSTSDACACDSNNDLHFNKGKGKKMGQGSYRAAKLIFSNMEVAKDSFVSLSAGDSIRLGPGFSAAAGSHFEALIKHCIPSSGLNESPIKGLQANVSGEDFKTNSDKELSRIQENWEATDSIVFLAPDDLQIFPNPFQSAATAWVSLSAPSKISLYVRSLTGNVIIPILQESYLPAGIHSFHFNSTMIPEGIVFASLVSEGQIITRKFIRNGK